MLELVSGLLTVGSGGLMGVGASLITSLLKRFMSPRPTQIELETKRLDVELQKLGRRVEETNLTHPLVYNLLRLVRPILTFVILGFVVWYFYSTAVNYADQQKIMNELTFLLSTMISWWFSDRTLNP